MCNYFHPVRADPGDEFGESLFAVFVHGGADSRWLRGKRDGHSLSIRGPKGDERWCDGVSAEVGRAVSVDQPRTKRLCSRPGGPAGNSPDRQVGESRHANRCWQARRADTSGARGPHRSPRYGAGPPGLAREFWSCKTRPLRTGLLTTGPPGLRASIFSKSNPAMNCRAKGPASLRD
jgi:hypothetical protein